MAGISGPSYLTPGEVIETESSEDRLQIAREEFFQILITELQSQDPLEPMDNQQMLAQLAQLETLDAQNKMTSGIDNLVETIQFSKLNDASSMLGKVVVGSVSQQKLDDIGLPVLDVDGNPVYEDVPVEGLAERVTSQEGELSLVVLAPVIGNDGQPVTDPQGNMITRQVQVMLNSIEEIRDPLINATQVSG